MSEEKALTPEEFAEKWGTVICGYESSKTAFAECLSDLNALLMSEHIRLLHDEQNNEDGEEEDDRFFDPDFYKY